MNSLLCSAEGVSQRELPEVRRFESKTSPVLVVKVEPQDEEPAGAPTAEPEGASTAELPGLPPRAEPRRARSPLCSAEGGS
mgnify:CR=1 FL=1